MSVPRIRSLRAARGERCPAPAENARAERLPVATSAYNQTGRWHWIGLAKVTATTGSPVLTMSNDTTNYNTSGGITGPVALVKAGAYTQILSGSGNYTGGTTILDGVLQLGNSAALGNGGLTANNGTLDLGGFSAAVAGLSGAAGMITNNGFGNSDLTIDQSAATTFGGTIVDGPIPHNSSRSVWRPR